MDFNVLNTPGLLDHQAPKTEEEQAVLKCFMMFLFFSRFGHNFIRQLNGSEHNSGTMLRLISDRTLSNPRINLKLNEGNLPNTPLVKSNDLEAKDALIFLIT